MKSTIQASWDWLSLKKNQATIVFIVGGIAAAIHFFSPAAPTATASAPNGIAIAGGNVSNPVVNNYATHEPNGLYQGGNKIGTVSAKHDTNDSKATITFRQVALMSAFDESKVIEYQNLLLKCHGNGVSVGPDTMIGGTASFSNFKCDVVAISPFEK